MEGYINEKDFICFNVRSFRYCISWRCFYLALVEN